MSSKLFFVQMKANLHLFLAESCGSGSRFSCWLIQLQLMAVPFLTTSESVFVCCFFGDSKRAGDFILDSYLENWISNIAPSESEIFPLNL